MVIKYIFFPVVVSFNPCGLVTWLPICQLLLAIVKLKHYLTKLLVPGIVIDLSK